MLIQVENLTHVYAPGTPFERTALQGVSLAIRPGERVGIVGPTGSGKSTLVQGMAGLLKPTSGRVLADGRPLLGDDAETRRRRLRVGLAFQYPEDQIFEQTVFREVAFGPRNLGLSDQEVTRRVHWALEMVDLDPGGIGERSPFSLSGGERRRVALASILAMQPEVLILDEPTAGQDPRSRRALLGRIHAWQEETGFTLVIVTHAVDELAGLVDRVVALNEGRVVADGPVRQVLGDAELMAAIGLVPPEPVALLYALRRAGKPVRTDRLLPEEAAREIAQVLNLCPKRVGEEAS